MASLKDIKRQIAELERKAEIIKRGELAKVVAAMKAQIEEYGLTPEDLFGGKRRGKAAATRSPARKAPVPKYQHPESGATWTGMGRAPRWILDAIEKGRKDDFLIAKVAAKAKTGEPTSAAAKSKAAVKGKARTAAPATSGKAAKPAPKAGGAGRPVAGKATAKGKAAPKKATVARKAAARDVAVPAPTVTPTVPTVAADSSSAG